MGKKASSRLAGGIFGRAKTLGKGGRSLPIEFSVQINNIDPTRRENESPASRRRKTHSRAAMPPRRSKRRRDNDAADDAASAVAGPAAAHDDADDVAEANAASSHNDDDDGGGDGNDDDGSPRCVVFIFPPFPRAAISSVRRQFPGAWGIGIKQHPIIAFLFHMPLIVYL